MKVYKTAPFTVIAAMMSLTAVAQLPPRNSVDPNPWNGLWKLDAKRSSPAIEAAGAPKAYRLTLGAGPASVVALKWEIPELGEVVTGQTDGQPMPIHRTAPTPGQTLSVRTDGSSGLIYSVFKNGMLIGGGRMMLIDNGAAWIDLTWPNDRQDLASELIYVKQQ